MPPLLPLKAPLGALGQLPELVKGGGILIGQLAAISLDGDLHRVILLFRFGEMQNLNRKGGPRHLGRRERPAEKAKAPEQHKAIRALGMMVWADWKRLFSQPWVEFVVVGVRLFLTSAYLFAIAWRHPPIAAEIQKSGGSDFSKPPLRA